MPFIAEFADQIFWIVKETAPFMLLGILFAGFLRYLISEQRFVRYFGKDDFRSVCLSALFGIPIPLCSCSVLPMMISLRQRGASKGATTSFLISAPETGVDSISITYALLGPIFTIARPLAALVSAVVTGSMVNLFVRKGWDKNGETPTATAGADSTCCRNEPAKGSEAPPQGSCGCESGEGGDADAPFWLRSVRYAFGPLVDSLTPLLILAFVSSALIGVILPDGFLENTIVQGWSGMFIMLLVGIPVYVCATSSTPLIAALILKGLSPGAALVFLLSGPVTNLGTIIAVMHQLGKRVMILYVVCTAGVTLLAGGIIDTLFADMGLSVRAVVGQSTETIPESLKIAAVVVLLALMLASAWRTRLPTRWAEKVRSLLRPLGIDPLGNRFAGLVLVVLILLYLTTAFTIVDVGETGWVFTLGKVERNAAGQVVEHEPGLLVHLPYPFQTVRVGKPAAVRSLIFGFGTEPKEANSLSGLGDEEAKLDLEAQVMDGQESLVSVRFAVHYRLSDSYAYTLLFDKPDEMISAFSGAAVRTVCARRSNQDILVTHRVELEAATRDLLQNELDTLGCGAEVLDVLFVDVHAPPEVHFAFRDVASATEEKHKQELMGESALRKTLAEARGRSYRIEQEALEYLNRRVGLAEGQADAFKQRSAAYNETRDVTRLRLYLTAMEEVLSATSLVLPLKQGIDVELWLRGSKGEKPPFLDAGAADSKDDGKEKEESNSENAAAKKSPEPDWFRALRR